MDSQRITPNSLIAAFESYATPKRSWRVGGEFERAVVRPDGRPVAYDDPDGIRWILEKLADHEGWQIIYEGDHPIALRRAGASITLEPGGQVELSGAPHANLSGLADEMRANRAALKSITEGHQLVWIACGLTPITPIERIGWVPKSRYRIMRNYLPERGDLATTMMKGTCSVQANFDYASETDCAAKVRLCAGLSPLTTAIFANSPLLENRPTGFKSYRGHVWTRTDRARCGFPPGLRSAYSHEKWVDYLLDTPMLFHRVGDTLQSGLNLPFRQFMTEGIDGTYPSVADWELHQTSVFPEVRIKHTIEVRGADCVDPDMAIAFCALFAGLLYCPAARDEATELIREIETHGSHAERFDVACRDGLAGMIGNRPLADWASDLGDIADRGIANCLPADRFRIDPLLDRIEASRCPADDLLEAWQRDPTPTAIVKAVTY